MEAGQGQLPEAGAIRQGLSRWGKKLLEPKNSHEILKILGS